jgi:hypothetical protein
VRSRTAFGTLIATAAFWWPGGAADADQLALSIEVPTEEVADWPFEVTTSWGTDAPRVLSVALLRATGCGENLEAGLELDPVGTVVIEATVTDPGTRTDEVTLVRFGSYLACAYLHSNPDPAAPADLVAQSAWPIEITTYDGTQPSQPSGVACGDVGGPRRITRVRAYGVRCRAARRVARRWGRRDEVGGYTCRRRQRKVTCTAAEARKVTFRIR